jgi:hypothetical protein
MIVMALHSCGGSSGLAVNDQYARLSGAVRGSIDHYLDSFHCWERRRHDGSQGGTGQVAGSLTYCTGSPY